MYCTPAELRLVATKLTATNETNPATDDTLNRVIERASRMFDLICGVPPEHFEAAEENAVATARTIYGDGTNYLLLPPYVPGTLNTTITLPDGYTVPTFIEQNGYLVLTSNGLVPPFARFNNCYWPGWYSGVAITVSAVWGFLATPADVNQAVIEWVLSIWRDSDPSQLKLIGLDGQISVLREKMPPRVGEISKRYRLKGSPAFV